MAGDKSTIDALREIASINHASRDVLEVLRKTSPLWQGPDAEARIRSVLYALSSVGWSLEKPAEAPVEQPKVRAASGE